MKHKQSRGFTLIEVLVASLLLAVLGIGVMLFFHRDTRVQAHLRAHQWSTLVADSVSAMVQGNVFDLSEASPLIVDDWEEGPMHWHITIRWIKKEMLSDRYEINVCEYHSTVCSTYLYVRWRYVST